METIALKASLIIRPIFDLALPISDSPNWIAKWVLYHTFRHLLVELFRPNLEIVFCEPSKGHLGGIDATRWVTGTAGS